MTEPGYETRDVKIRPLVWLATSIVLGAAVVHVALWLLLTFFKEEARNSDPPRSPLAAQTQTPPTPRLQERPVHDYQSLRAEQEQVLHSYGWIDKERGIVRIPIERAMEIFVERGDTR